MKAQSRLTLFKFYPRAVLLRKVAIHLRVEMQGQAWDQQSGFCQKFFSKGLHLSSKTCLSRRMKLIPVPACTQVGFCSVNEAGGADHSAETLTVFYEPLQQHSITNVGQVLPRRSEGRSKKKIMLNVVEMCRMPVVSLRAKVILPLLNNRMLG